VSKDRLYHNINKWLKTAKIGLLIAVFLILAIGSPFCILEATYKDWKNIPDKPVDIDNYYCVFGTRIGLVGKRTYTGHLIKKDCIFVALPHYEALKRWVEIKYKDKVIVCQVLDVGAWSTLDKYWEYERRPLAETRQRLPKEWETIYRKPSNPAGIDLSDGLVKALGISKAEIGVWVYWRFCDKRTK